MLAEVFMWIGFTGFAMFWCAYGYLVETRGHCEKSAWRALIGAALGLSLQIVCTFVGMAGQPEGPAVTDTLCTFVYDKDAEVE